MTHSRVALLAAVLLFAPGTAAHAQMIVGPAAGPGPVMGPGPGPMPGSSGMVVGPAGPGGMPGPAVGPGPSAGMPPCMSQFLPLRAEAEKRAGVLQAGINKKKPPPEICQLFRSFSEAEAKVVNFAAANQAGCGIPPDAVASMKKNHAKTNEVRDKVCTVAEQKSTQPTGPHLGEALGFGGLPTAETTRAGTGTLDSLSGNPLAK
ncbi:MAG TPA: hypothetical protein VK456_16665 [Xanthobacteraceae bacterium]|nr:hypothetical protein [Xanthobacteraceae bacterium]